MGVDWGSTRYIAGRITAMRCQTGYAGSSIPSIWIFVVAWEAGRPLSRRMPGEKGFRSGCIEAVLEWKPRAKRVAPPSPGGAPVSTVLDRSDLSGRMMRMGRISGPSGISSRVESSQAGASQVPILATGAATQHPIMSRSEVVAKTRLTLIAIRSTRVVPARPSLDACAGCQGGEL